MDPKTASASIPARGSISDDNVKIKYKKKKKQQGEKSLFIHCPKCQELLFITVPCLPVLTRCTNCNMLGKITDEESIEIIIYRDGSIK